MFVRYLPEFLLFIVGYYFATVCKHLSDFEKDSSLYTEKVVKQLNKLKDYIKDFPRHNSEDIDIHAVLEQIRGNFRMICSLLKAENEYATTIAISF